MSELLGLDELPLIVHAISHDPSHRAIKGNQEPGHHRIVARCLGQLEESLDQRLMAKRVQRTLEVGEQEATCRRRAVGVPAGGEGCQLVGVGDATETVDELRVSPFEEFFNHKPVTAARHGHSSQRHPSPRRLGGCTGLVKIRASFKNHKRLACGGQVPSLGPESQHRQKSEIGEEQRREIGAP